MESKIKRWAVAASLLALSTTGLLAQTQPTGQWDFNDPANGLKATIGADLSYIGTADGTQFGTTTSFGISNIGGAAANVMLFPTNTVGMGLSMPTPAAGNGGGAYVNNYTLVMDILFPASSVNKLRALLEADLGTINPDAEFFVSAQNGIGAKGQSFGTIQSNTWYRIGIVAEVPEGGSAVNLRFYIDGNEVGSRASVSPLDDRFALNPAGAAYLFTDDTEETASGYVNSIQLWNVALSKGQMRALGVPSAAGLPQTLPPVPSGIDKWIPHGDFAGRNTPVGAVIDPGSTTIQDSSISLKLNGWLRPTRPSVEIAA